MVLIEQIFQQIDQEGQERVGGAVKDGLVGYINFKETNQAGA